MDSPFALAFQRHREKTFRIVANQLYQNMTNTWKGSVIGEECSLHQIAPYIGKMKSSMAKKNLGARQRYFGIGMALPVMDFAISST